MKRFLIDSLFNKAKMASKRITRQTYSKAVIMENRERYLSMSLEEKRKLYKCSGNYVTLDNVPLWSLWYKTHGKNEETTELINGEFNSKIGIFLGDITCLEIDCIVNAANKSLLGGGGVDGAIHRAAGKLLYEECTTLNGCETSEAKITAGYNLPAKYVIHTVGPIGYDAEALKKAYLNSLNLAIDNNCRSIAFPCISTGVYGFPIDKASLIVAKTVREFLEKKHEKFDRIIFCLFTKESIDFYNKYLSIYFPVSENFTESKPNKQIVTKDEKEFKSEESNEEMCKKTEDDIKESKDKIEQKEMNDEKLEVKQEKNDNQTNEINIKTELYQKIESEHDIFSSKEESK